MQTNDDGIGYYTGAELVFGIVSPIGIDYKPIIESLKLYLEHFGYSAIEIKISDRFEELAQQLKIPPYDGEYSGRMASMWKKIQMGDQICSETKRKDILALVAAAEIESQREASEKEPTENKDRPRTAHIIISLKRPEEVAMLRRIYGTGFFLIGLTPSEKERKTFFDERGLDESQRSILIKADAAEKGDYGQRTRNTFFLSDVFISLDDHSTQIARFVDLVFGYPFHTPTFEERSMYLAYAASLTSGDLARQVGAALMSAQEDCLGIGWNDVPRPGGGLYGPAASSKRDMDRKEDSNDTEKLTMAVAIIRSLRADIDEPSARSSARELLDGTGFFDITEFGRAVHAEMAALLACARTGRSPVGAVLFVTTFPCHNCTRHIIASGLSKVYYIEPYAKSKAIQLHGDACMEALPTDTEDKRIPFLPFIGIGPRRYLDLFSLTLGTGYPIERKENGRMAEWSRQKATPRLQMPPVSYLVREQLASTTLNTLLSADYRHPKGDEVGHDGTEDKFLGSDQPSS